MHVKQSEFTICPNDTCMLHIQFNQSVEFSGQKTLNTGT